MCKRLDEGNKAKWLGRLHIGAGLKSDPVMSSMCAYDPQVVV